MGCVSRNKKEMGNQMSDNKESINGLIPSIGLLKKWFSFSGRATRRDYWLTVLWQCIWAAVLTIAMIGVFVVASMVLDVVAIFLAVPFIIALAALVVAGWANLFRRLHDLGLSGFWTCYLTPFGLSFLYGAYVMDADVTAKAAVDRIKNVGSPWLSWILAYFLWPAASFFAMLLVLLSPGQKQDNVYGANPYVTE